MKNRKIIRFCADILPLLVVVFMSGCYDSYVTPATGADMGIFHGTLTESGSFRGSCTPQPTAQFPVTLAVARIQGAGYYQNEMGYCVVNSPLSGTQATQNGFANLQGISQVVPINKLLIAGRQKSPDTLRHAAASLKAHMLYIYTLDTEQDETDWSSAASLYTLGLSPTVKVEVTTTAMGMLVDTQTGYVYGVMEARAAKEQTAAYMTRQNAWDQCRKITEEEAFEEMNKKFPTMWNDVLSRYGQGISYGVRVKRENTDDRLDTFTKSGRDESNDSEPVETQFWK